MELCRRVVSPTTIAWRSWLTTLLVGVSVGVIASGCEIGRIRLDAQAIASARAALMEREDETDVYYDEYEEDDTPSDDEPGIGTVIVAELLAIFPGLFVHGIGHSYAGDTRTATRLSRVGQFGYLMTGLGAGAVIGGYYLDDSVDGDAENITDPIAYSLYGVGGVVGAVGLTYFFTAWIYDMVDTPRAVLSGGKAPRRTPFVDALEIFDR